VNVLHQDPVYPAPGLLVPLIGSHDVQRFMNEDGATTAGLKLAATFLLTMRGIPQWYYGDEIAMPGGNDPDNRRDFPGGWKEDALNAFDAAGRTREQEDVFGHVQRLMRLRRELEPLRRGSLVHLAVDEQSYAFARRSPAGTVIVVLNNGAAAQTVTVDLAPIGLPDGAVLEDRLGAAPAVTVSSGRVEIPLPPRGSAIYTVRERPGALGRGRVPIDALASPPATPAAPRTVPRIASRAAGRTRR
jgi:hypothetical protein